MPSRHNWLDKVGRSSRKAKGEKESKIKSVIELAKSIEIHKGKGIGRLKAGGW